MNCILHVFTLVKLWLFFLTIAAYCLDATECQLHDAKILHAP